MNVQVEALSSGDKDEWNRAVARSPQTTFFHQYEALRALARHFDASLQTLIGYVGEEPVGVFPVFGQSKGPFLLATTPPLGVEISTGPALLNFEKLKQRKAEKRHGAFVDGCLDWIDEEMDPDLLELKTPPRYTDVRPFLRRDCDVEPSYTYHIDLRPDEDELLKRFSKDGRRNVRNADDDEYEIMEGGVRAIEAIASLLQRRYRDLNVYHYLDADLVTDLYESVESGRVCPYVCAVDGTVAGGAIALEYGDTVYSWQGMAEPGVDLPVNDLVDWHIIREGKRRGRELFDFVGAMLPRLCEYKAKFGPKPVPLYVVKRKTIPARLAEESYRRMPTRVRRLVGL